VQYVDYEHAPHEIGDQISPVVFKRVDFAHEHEIRAYCHDDDGIPPFDGAAGVSFPVQLETLVEEVVVSPKSPAWFAEHVAAVLKSNGVQAVPVRRSTLYQSPGTAHSISAREMATRRDRAARAWVIFPDQAAFEAWRRRELASKHYPRFGRAPHMGAINLTTTLTTDITKCHPHPNPGDRRVVCVVPWPHTTRGLEVVELDWIRKAGWKV
jgi:hypothetical protein